MKILNILFSSVLLVGSVTQAAMPKNELAEDQLHIGCSILNLSSGPEFKPSRDACASSKLYDSNDTMSKGLGIILRNLEDLRASGYDNSPEMADFIHNFSEIQDLVK